MIEMSEAQRLLAIERQIATEFARGKIAGAMYEVLLEGMEFGPCELPQAEDREWIRGAMAVPLQEATDAALASLSWGMVRALERAPNGLLDRFERSHRWQELGWE
jgi:hypothetical protein